MLIKYLTRGLDKLDGIEQSVLRFPGLLVEGNHCSNLPQLLAFPDQVAKLLQNLFFPWFSSVNPFSVVER